MAGLRAAGGLRFGVERFGAEIEGIGFRAFGSQVTQKHYVCCSLEALGAFELFILASELQIWGFQGTTLDL